LTSSETPPAPEPGPDTAVGASEPRPRFGWAALLVCVLLGLATWLTFGHVLGNDFVNYDDPDHVYENPQVRAGLSAAGLRWALTTTHANNPCWQPLTWLSFMLDSDLQGTGPRGYHRTNLLLHVANTLLLFVFLWHVTGRVGRSGLVAALFALHPLHVESVAWVAERKDVLSTLFWALTLCAYAGYVARPGVVRYLLVLVPFALGLMAKPMLVTLPCLLLLLDYWPLGRWQPAGAPAPGAAGLGGPVPFRRLLAEKVPLFVVAAAASVGAFLAQRGALGSLEQLPFLPRLANALTAYATYLRQTFWPVGLAAFYPYPQRQVPPGPVVGAALLLVTLTVAFLAGARRWPYLAVGWLWFLGTLVPVIGLVQVGSHAHADRYTYVPLVGLFLLLVWGGADLLARFRCPAALSATFAGLVLWACALVTWLQVCSWHDSVTLWRHALEVTADNYVAHDNLGVALSKQGKQAEALGHYAEAVRLNPNFAEARYNLGVALEERGQPEQAFEQYRAVVRLNPRHARAHYNLGVALWARGALDEAAEHYAAALEIDPRYASAWHNLGIVRWQQGRPDGAIACGRRAVELGPDVTRFHIALAFALCEQGRSEEGERHYGQARRLDPNWPRAISRDAWVLATHPDPKERSGANALLLARQACRAPGGRRPEALDTLAAALAESGHFEEAARTAREAVTLARAEGATELVPALEHRLRLYQARQPFRMNMRQ
jgi:tetratricopeptide (TPR) repeat protein